MHLAINLRTLTDHKAGLKAVVAGGFCSDIFARINYDAYEDVASAYQHGDIDIFLIDDSPVPDFDSYNRTLEKLIAMIHESLPASWAYKCIAYCTDHAVSIHVKHRRVAPTTAATLHGPNAKSIHRNTQSRDTVVKYQLILTVHPSLHNLLLSFDIDACAMAYDGANFFATPRALKAQQTMTIMASPEHVTAPTAKRLIKYWKRGFSICDPSRAYIASPRAGLLESLSERVERGKRKLAALGYDDMEGNLTPETRIMQVWDHALELDLHANTQEAVEWMVAMMHTQQKARTVTPASLNCIAILKTLIYDGFFFHLGLDDTPPAELIPTTVADPFKCTDKPLRVGLLFNRYPYFTRFQPIDGNTGVCGWKRAPSLECT
eukprot:851120-Rhodomonas_salina.1